MTNQQLSSPIKSKFGPVNIQQSGGQAIHFWQNLPAVDIRCLGKVVKVRYVPRGLSPDRFLERFKQALYDVRGQGVDVSPSVELALFMQSIKSHCNSTKFLADMKASIYAQDFMDKVYEQFLEDQSAGIAPSMTILDALREDVEL